MKKNFRGMTLAALLLSASTSAQADNNEYVHGNATSQAFVGDIVTNVPTDRRSSYVGTVAPTNDYAPVTIGDLQPTGYYDGGYSEPISYGSGCASGMCDTVGCDGGCDSGCGSKHGQLGRRLADAFNMCNSDGWIRAEALIMFMQNRQSPALVSSADPGLFPVLPDGVVEFGEELDGGVSGGFRADVGRYLTDRIGVGGRFTWIGENGDDFSMTGSGLDANGRSIGRPYYFTPTVNPGIAGEDSLIVSQLNLFSGSVDASFSTELVGAEAYGRLLFCKNKASRLEMIGGYSHWSLDDELGIRSTTTDLQTATSNTFASRFDAENRFNGGQVGFESVITRGKWTARTLSKIHLGNMERTVNISGYSDESTAGAAPQPRTNSSLLVGAQQGEESDDEFTFIPELNFTLGYRFREHVSFTVGYNFMYFDSVALAGQQINRNIDTTNLGAQVVPTGFDIVDGSLWVQGISLGASVDY
ncbi:BBP7 family outer membrane beta-barrel protein [Stieleria sp. TO1_6]|uniref:BBP7 family outer membrane beta-barrel protein n=1 Tax=Stieleria tagensis TaxID=2956795 RepID=UPI00209AC51E|nr:BBP7 family outer membrane beta-barrel protein [Stieleria tagensis]MCO8120838.1 BBP7 family outer membrane beta-barrel protein [Stieleria tagensis]